MTLPHNPLFKRHEHIALHETARRLTMTLPKTASNKQGITMKMKDVERLDTLARKIALPISRVLDSDLTDDQGNVLVSEKVALDTEKAWKNFNDAFRKISMKGIKNLLGESKSTKPRKPQVQTNGEGST